MRFSFIFDIHTSKINELLIYIIKKEYCLKLIVSLCDFYCFNFFFDYSFSAQKTILKTNIKNKLVVAYTLYHLSYLKLLYLDMLFKMNKTRKIKFFLKIIFLYFYSSS